MHLKVMLAELILLNYWINKKTNFSKGGLKPAFFVTFNTHPNPP
jgi:hypothetical protein